jgi:predicted DNA-binding transcriptional regulator AlpA
MSETLLRFRHLKARNIVSGRTQLKRLQDHHGFPRGKFLGPNSIAWTEAEVAAWIASRPATREEAIAESEGNARGEVPAENEDEAQEKEEEVEGVQL